jgi:hypothetical protein
MPDNERSLRDELEYVYDDGQGRQLQHDVPDGYEYTDHSLNLNKRPDDNDASDESRERDDDRGEPEHKEGDDASSQNKQAFDKADDKADDKGETGDGDKNTDTPDAPVKWTKEEKETWEAIRALAGDKPENQETVKKALNILSTRNKSIEGHLTRSMQEIATERKQFQDLQQRYGALEQVLAPRPLINHLANSTGSRTA